jgi:hypothetical protein
MSARIRSIFLLVLGKVGSLVATLLHERRFEVTGADLHDQVGLPCPTEKFDFSKGGRP